MKKALFLGSLLLLTQCVTTAPSQTSTPGGSTARVDVNSAPDANANTLDKGCPLDKLQWLYASQKFSANQQDEIAGKLALAAQTDAATLDRMVANKNNNPLGISSALTTAVEELAHSRTPVNEVFYKQYASNRMTMCAVIDALRSGSIKQDESSKIAGNAFREVAKSFESLKTK